MNVWKRKRTQYGERVDLTQRYAVIDIYPRPSKQNTSFNPSHNSMFAMRQFPLLGQTRNKPDKRIMSDLAETTFR